jgi:hypothetical protein
MGEIDGNASSAGWSREPAFRWITTRARTVDACGVATGRQFLPRRLSMLSFLRDSNKFVRVGTAASLIGSAVLVFVGIAITPWEGDTGTRGEMWQALHHPAQFQIAALFLHFGFLLTGPAVFGLSAITARRAPVLGRLGLLVGTLGVTTLPGLLISDWFMLGLAQSLGLDGAVTVIDSMNYPAMLVILLPAVFGWFLGIILLGFAAWRAGLVAIWVPGLLIAGFVLAQFVGTSQLIPVLAGTTLSGVAYVCIAVAVLRQRAVEAEAAPSVIVPAAVPGQAV